MPQKRSNGFDFGDRQMNVSLHTSGMKQMPNMGQ